MSLLKRIETIRAGGTTTAEAPAPAEGELASAVQPVAPTPPDHPRNGGPTAQTLSAQAQRLISQAPIRESFRETKFRVQTKVISDLDPKLDLANQIAGADATSFYPLQGPYAGDSGRVYWMGFDPSAEPLVITDTGYYDDIYVRTSNGWRIKQRHAHPDPRSPGGGKNRPTSLSPAR